MANTASTMSIQENNHDSKLKETRIPDYHQSIKRFDQCSGSKSSSSKHIEFENRNQLERLQFDDLKGFQ